MQIDQAPMATAQLLDPHLAALRLVAHRGFGSEFLDFFAVVDDAASACGRALLQAQPVWVSDTARSPVFAGTEALAMLLDAGSRAVASVPVTSPTGTVIGMISPHHSQPVEWATTRARELERLARLTGRVLDHFIASDRSAQTDARSALG
jgi:GAF domain-containing protein